LFDFPGFPDYHSMFGNIVKLAVMLCFLAFHLQFRLFFCFAMVFIVYIVFLGFLVFIPFAASQSKKEKAGNRTRAKQTAATGKEANPRHAYPRFRFPHTHPIEWRSRLRIPRT